MNVLPLKTGKEAIIILILLITVYAVSCEAIQSSEPVSESSTSEADSSRTETEGDESTSQDTKNRVAPEENTNKNKTDIKLLIKFYNVIE